MFLVVVAAAVHSSGANGQHGFVAEIVTLPIAAIGFGRDVRHNVSYSSFVDNRMGAVRYAAAGETTPTLTMEWNRIVANGRQLYGNFTTCPVRPHLLSFCFLGVVTPKRPPLGVTTHP